MSQKRVSKHTVGDLSVENMWFTGFINRQITLCHCGLYPGVFKNRKEKGKIPNIKIPIPRVPMSINLLGNFGNEIKSF